MSNAGGLVSQVLDSPGEAFLNALYEGISEGVLAVSLETHQIVYWNKGAAIHFGYTADEVRNQSAVFLYPDEDSFNRMQRAYEPSLLAHGSWFGEWQFKRRDESIFPAEVTFSIFLKDDDGRNAFAVMVVRDISERKASLRRIERSNALLLLHHRVAAAAGAALHWTEAVKVSMQHLCAYGYWSVGHALLYDTKLHPFYSSHVWHFAEDDAGRYEPFQQVSSDVGMDARRGFIGRVLTERKPQWIADLSATDLLQRRKEEAAACGLRSAFAFPVVFDDRVVAALELFSKDTLEPDRPLIEVAESLGVQLGRIFERQEAEINAREQERMATIGLTAAKIAHEIGNPLNGMFTTAQLLERKCVGHLGRPLDQDTCDTVSVLVKETDRLRMLLDELRRLSFPNSLEPEPRDIVESLTGLLKTQEQILRDAGVKVRMHFAPALPEVPVMPERFDQALLNLIKNAVEAMPEGGDLILRAYQMRGDVVIEVSDTGVGIPKELPIFDLFITSKASGTGLGLAVVQQVVTAHHGTIDYWSVPGEGTTFRLVLPSMAKKQD